VLKLFYTNLMTTLPSIPKKDCLSEMIRIEYGKEYRLLKIALNDKNTNKSYMQNKIRFLTT